jgi:hypothetical protein
MKQFFSKWALGATLLLAATGMSMAGTEAQVEFFLQNKCSRTVNYSVSLNGKVEKGSLEKGEKKKLCYDAGAQITVDGDAFMTLAAKDDGETFVACR